MYLLSSGAEEVTDALSPQVSDEAMCPISSAPSYQEMKQMIGKSLGWLAVRAGGGRIHCLQQADRLYSRKKLFSLDRETKKQIQLRFIKLMKHMLKSVSATHSSALSHK